MLRVRLAPVSDNPLGGVSEIHHTPSHRVLSIVPGLMSLLPFALCGALALFKYLLDKLGIVAGLWLVVGFACGLRG